MSIKRGLPYPGSETSLHEFNRPIRYDLFFLDRRCNEFFQFAVSRQAEDGVSPRVGDEQFVF